MISLFSPKGGVGRTTIAYNLAVALGADHSGLPGRWLAAVQRPARPAAGAGDRAVDREPANRPHPRGDVADVAWKDPSGIDILLAPPRVEMAEMVTVRDIEKSLSILRQLYQFVVIDTRAGLGDDVLVFLDASDLILQVLTYDSMAIRNLAMAGEAFDAIGYPATKLATVLNRSDSTGGITQGRCRDGLGSPIDFEIVSDGRLVVAANNEGVPFVSGSPDAPISQGIRNIAASPSAHLRERARVLASRADALGDPFHRPGRSVSSTPESAA